MTESDIEYIERSLAIKLPESFRTAVVPFGVPALQGNTDYELWDDAAALVELNQKLRAGSRFCPAWPAHFFAVGDPHGDELITIDLRQPEGAVWWFDHGIIDASGSYNLPGTFGEWAQEFYQNIRDDFKGDGHDPDGSPEALKASVNRDLKSGFVGCVVALFIAVSAVIALFFFVTKK